MEIMDQGSRHLDLSDPVRSADENSTEIRIQRNPVTKCFSNLVIMDCILEYLDHSSTKMFSQSCHSILTLIRSSPAFVDKSIFCVPPAYHSRWWFSEGDEHIVDLGFLQNVNFPWTSVRIMAFYLDNVATQIVTNLLSRVVRLELAGRVVTMESERFKATDLCRFLVAAQSLKELVIDETYVPFTEVDRTTLMSNSEVQAIFKNLEVLHIKSDANNNDDSDTMPAVCAERLGLGETVNALLGVPTNLCSFLFECDRDLTDATFVKSFLTSLRKHVNTLISLDLRNCAWNTDEVLDLVCPNLKELKIMADEEHLPRVCEFIMKQGQRLKLDVDLSLTGPLSLKALVDTLLQCGSPLITLSLVWDLNPHVGGPSLDFPWLQTLSKLKNISIRQYTRCDRHPEAIAPMSNIFGNLPSGIKILNCVGSHADFGLEEAEYTQRMIENLGRFHDLTVLNLFHCYNALNDDILLFISSNLTQLREFGFSFCHKITEIGFTAIGALKRLMKLKIFQCKHIPNSQEILLSFSFPELKELWIDDECVDFSEVAEKDWKEVVDEYFKKIVSRNRMLEKLVIEQHYNGLEHVLTKHCGRMIHVELLGGNAY